MRRRSVISGLAARRSRGFSRCLRRRPQLQPAPPAQPLGSLAPAPDAAPAVPQAPPASAPQVPPAPPPPKSRDIVVHVEVIHGGYTNVKVPIAICPRYEGMALAGPAKEFDRQLDSWLTRTVDLGMIGSGLGQLFPIHFQSSQEPKRVKVDALLLVGMGQPGDFAADDLRYLMSNVTVAVKSMRQDGFSTMLIGTRRNELTIGQAVRGFLQGIVDGYARFRVIADAVTFHRDLMRESAENSLRISLVEGDPERAERILEEFRAVAEEGSIPEASIGVGTRRRRGRGPARRPEFHGCRPLRTGYVDSCHQKLDHANRDLRPEFRSSGADRHRRV